MFTPGALDGYDPQHLQYYLSRHLRGDCDVICEYAKALNDQAIDHGDRVDPHMLLHACDVALAEQGADTRIIRDYLGHRNIQQTVNYTATNRRTQRSRDDSWLSSTKPRLCGGYPFNSWRRFLAHRPHPRLPAQTWPTQA